MHSEAHLADLDSWLRDALRERPGIIRALQRRYDLTKKHDLHLHVSIDITERNSNSQIRPP